MALELVRHRPQLTRRELAGELGLASGAASDLVGRLRAAQLVAERPAPTHGPGRPTTSFHAHPSGPLVLALDVRHADWRLAACGIDGEPELLASGRHTGKDARAVLRRLRAIVTRAADRLGGRALGVGVAVPGPVAGTRLLDATMRGWRDVELSRVGGGLPVVAGNDATMAAVATARTHPTADALLHLVLEVGIGGALVLGGHPVQGARGLAGEFGHMPFGDPGEVCGCGARGCWGARFDPPRIAARFGERDPADPRRWLYELFEAAEPSADERRVRSELAADLGRGTAGLVNALDPDMVTLGGLAGPLRNAAPRDFEHAFEAGLMRVHRDDAPEVIVGAADENEVLVGVALTAFDEVLDARRLALWAMDAR
ncbi:MAG TPA: ROK family transcriptional regulator [Solirubrobacteraceae bacterium]|nr:ROK family transcriptional regulator [Solirubrobacteraceae bacterium]